MIEFKNIADKYFLEWYLPAIMYKKALQLANDVRAKRMDEYLKETLKISLRDVINQVATSFEVNYEDNKTVLKLNNSILEKKSQEKLSALVRLINDGNTEVKGTKILDNLKKYIHDNVQVIYSSYIYHNGKEKEDVS